MGITHIPFEFPGLKKVRCFFQTRQGGISKHAYADGNISYVTEDLEENVFVNRCLLRNALSYPFSELTQVHGDELIFEPVPTEDDKLKQGQLLPEADGLATTQAGLALMIKSADCQPVLIAHKDEKHVMALHVGWRGNKICFIQSAVRKFCQHYALNPKDLLAVRGPSLGPFASEFLNFSSEWGDDFKPWYDTKLKTMDLWNLTKHQLQDAGLLPRQIFGLDLCTYHMSDLFFSYRQEKNSGRQASLIWIEP